MTNTAGRFVLGAAGAVIGFYLGGPAGASLGLSLGFAAGTIIFPPEGREVVGQRLDDLNVAFSTYGKVITILEGYADLGANFVWATPLKEHRVKQEIEGEKGQPPSTTVITFLYTSSFRTNFCEGPIGAILKFWGDKVLIGDITSSGSVGLLSTVNVVELNGELTSVGNPAVRIFLGEEDQLAGPAETADKGIDSTPAYRGQGGAEWEDFLTTAYGNRIPNISALVTMEAGDPKPFELIDRDGGAISETVRYTSDPTIITLGTTRIIDLTIPDIVDVISIPDLTGGVLHDIDYLGRQWGSIDLASPLDHERLTAWDAITGEVLITAVGTSKLAIVNPLIALNGGRTGFVGVGFVGRITQYDPQGEPLRDPFSSPPFQLSDYFAAPSGGYKIGGGADWAFASESGNSWLAINGESDGNAYLIEFDSTTATPLQRQTLTGRTIQYMTYLPSRNALILLDTQSSEIARFDLDTLTIDSTVAATLVSSNRNAATTDVIVNGEMYIQEGATGTGGVYDVESDTMVRDRSFNPRDWIGGTANWEGYAYDLLNNAIIVTKTSQGSDKYGWVFLDRKSTVGTNPQKVVERYSSKVGYLPSTDIDASAISTPTFPSYIMNRRITVRRGFEPLFTAFDIFSVESDWLVKFFKGGGAPTFTLTEDDIGATAGTEPTSEPMEIQRLGTENLFETGTIDYIDEEFDFQTVTQPFKRNREAISVEGSLNFPFPGGLTKDQAVQVIEGIVFRAWNGRLRFKTPVNWDHILLDPGDVGTLTYKGQTYQVQIKKKEYGANGVIELEMASDDTETHTSVATGGSAEGFGPETITAVGSTTLHALDIVLLNDLDDYLGTYFAAGSPSATWPGSATFRGVDASDLSAYAAYPSNKEAIIGVAKSVLPDADPDVWDRTSSVTVRFFNGTMSSDTEVNVLDGANAVLVGDEVVNPASAVLNADGTVTLSVFLRGSAGSEWATGTHVLNERVVVLSTAGLVRQAQGVGELGKTFFYAPKTLGRDNLGTIQEVTNQFVSAKPRAPAHVNGVRSGNDWILSGVRRTRLDGPWLNFTDLVPLGEATESYEWDIPISGSPSRVLTAATPSVTYTEAQQVTDFGSVQDTLTWTMHQMSADVGRGFGTTETITGA